ncbi:sensor histidine kinase [Tenacibaculum jejuense]|uniref:Two-component system sensor histidine kinase n=1 Tax=Tenacibaculum jejuense TaxID=584609 RepID=A0A238U9V2_9FLAO|nr:histidine kinase [Tenacibaculum jejuense]SNR15766.1 Two-component system sensor histidine kinase [Tenacibaculum jejuense]
MKLFDKEKRIQYLGFNDFWFSTIGIIVISFVTSFLFNDMSMDNPFIILFIRWSSSLFFTILDWLIIRAILIFLRRQFPDFKDDTKRITALFIAIIAVILLVDFSGGNFLTFFFSLFGMVSTYSMNFKVLLPIIIIVVMDMAIYEAIYYYVRLKKSIREEEQTKQVMIQAQLDTLTNQAKPHFLFNSLNTLRDIIDVEDKEDAKVFVDKLSDVYRFILESGNSNLLQLHEELKFVKSYIHIQKERFGDNFLIDWDISEDKLSTMIIPMSLQLLIENAIKHNVVSKAKPLIVSVKTEGNQLIVSNKIQKKSTQLPSTKIGLKNITRRYSLVSDKAIEINNDGEFFTVILPLLKIQDQK